MTGDPMTDSRLELLLAALRDFRDSRDWARFHTPKNLAMAIAGEAGELAAEFQWLTPEESDSIEGEKRDAVAAEMADVLIYLLMLSDRLGVDPVGAALEKTARNEQRFPVSGS